MLKFLAIIALFYLNPATCLAQINKEIVGKYQMNVQGGDILELRGDGSATMAGDVTRWSAKGNQLSLGAEVMQFSLKGGSLMLMMGSVQIEWKKIGGAGSGTIQHEQSAVRGKSPPLNNQATASPSTNGNTQDAQARQILTQNAWCSSTYNKVSGTSTTRKVIFYPNGVMAIKGGAETYSSGYGGNYAGQSNKASTMKWKLNNLRMYVDQGNGAGFQDIGLTATKNSNGYVILKADGREYMMCD